MRVKKIFNSSETIEVGVNGVSEIKEDTKNVPISYLVSYGSLNLRFFNIKGVEYFPISEADLKNQNRPIMIPTNEIDHHNKLNPWIWRPLAIGVIIVIALAIVSKILTEF